MSTELAQKSPLPIAIVAGVGDGTGTAVARRFAKAYPVVLLARRVDSLQPLVQEIQDAGGEAIAIGADVSSRESLDSAFACIAQQFPGAKAAACVFNASSRPAPKPFLDSSLQEVGESYDISVKGAFLFAQASLPLLLGHADNSGSSTHPPTLIVTGATASVKASARFAAFAASKHALRALSLSLAREFAPHGVHIAHAVIDGVIDVPLTGKLLSDKDPLQAKIGPEDIAECYWNLHAQSRRAFTHEIDLRPMLETW